MAAGTPRGCDAAEIRQRAGSYPEDAAPRRLRDRLQLLIGGADIGKLDRIERARRGERRARTVGDTIKPAFGDGETARAAPAGLRREGERLDLAVGPRDLHRSLIFLERLPRHHESV